jgi:hypothetical protein
VIGASNIITPVKQTKVDIIEMKDIFESKEFEKPLMMTRSASKMALEIKM